MSKHRLSSSVPKSARKVRILVVDDHPLFREGLVQFINRQLGFVACGEAESVARTRTALATLKPDLLLLDLCLGDGDGLELIKEVRAQLPKMPILVLSQMDEALYAERVLRAGANGYVMKEEATEEVLNGIRTVMKGELHVSRRISVIVLHRLLETKREGRTEGLASLTDRELQVFQMLGAGLKTREIAHELKLSSKTIETYRENLKHKLGLGSAAELVKQAIQWIEKSRGGPGRPSRH
jgi:DNA-binding NarL/FixJ family response regulator